METPPKAYRLLVNCRLICNPIGADKKLPLPRLKAIKPVEIPAYFSRDHFDRK